MNILIVSDNDFLLRRIMADVRLYTEADIFTLKWYHRDSVSYPDVRFDVAVISVEEIDSDWMNMNAGSCKSVFIDSDRLKNIDELNTGSLISFARDLYHKLTSI